MVRYDTEIRKPEDILFRSSRPQRNSSHIPRARDWRYATGVFRHEDIVDVRSESTIWDNMDRDFNVGKAGGKRKRKSDDRDERKDEVREEMIQYHENVDDEVDGEGGKEEKKTLTPRKKTKSPTGSPKEDILKKGSRAVRVGIFEPTGDTGSGAGKREYIQTGLIVRLQLAGKTPVYTPKMLAKPLVSTPTKLHRPATPTMGFRASGAPPTPPSTIKSVSRGRSRDSTPIEGSALRDDSGTSYVKINTSDETITANVVMPIRDVFTFPLLAIIAMAGEGVKMGLEKASQRKKVREEEEVRKAKPMKTDILQITIKPDHVPKIEREIRDSASLLRKDNEAKKLCGTPQVSRELRGTMASPQEQYDPHEPNCTANDAGGPQDAAALPLNEAIVLEEPQTMGAMTPPTNNAALAPKSISPHPMLHVLEQDIIEVGRPPLALYPSETKNMASESPVPNAASRAPMAVEEIVEAPVKREEISDVAKRSRILETLRQAQEAAPEPLKKHGDAMTDKHPATAEQAQAELEQRLNALLEQEEEQEFLVMPDMHAEQARTECEKSEISIEEKEKQEDVVTGEDLFPSTEQAQAELEQRRRILLEKMEKQADVTKSDHVLAQIEVIPASEARSGQIKEYTGGNVQEYDGSAPDCKATSTEEVEAEMKEFFDEMVEKVNAVPVCSSASQLPSQLPTTEAPSLPPASPPIDYDTHGNPIPRTPKRPFDDEHANGMPKKSKMMPFASSSNVISNRAWRRDGAPRAPRTANYHSRGSQQYLSNQPHHSSRYPSGTTQPYRRTQAPSAARPYSCAQYPAPSNLSGSHGHFGGRSYTHAYHPPTALASGNHGSYNVQQYTGSTAGAILHYSGAATHEAASTPRGGTERESRNLQGKEKRRQYELYGGR